MLNVKKLILKEKIYAYTQYCGFGDMWAVASYLLRVSEELKKPVRFFAQSSKQRDIIRAVLPHLRSKGKVDLVPAPTAKMKWLGYCEPFRVKFVPTYRRWKYNKYSNLVAYQFDGRHLAAEKNLPPQRLKYLLDSLHLMGYHTVDVGHKKPLEFIIDVLAKCKFFIGCPSGLSVVSASVGNPVFLITRAMHPLFLKFMQECQYRTKSVHMFTTVDEFLIHVKRMNRCGKLL
jgi:hypothetical protein